MCVKLSTNCVFFIFKLSTYTVQLVCDSIICHMTVGFLILFSLSFHFLKFFTFLNFSSKNKPISRLFLTLEMQNHISRPLQTKNDFFQSFFETST